MTATDSLSRRDFGLTVGVVAAGSLLTSLAHSQATIAKSLPRFGDVVVSIRTDIQRAGAAIFAYRPDRIEWHYARSSAFIQAAKLHYGVRFVEGTINTNPPDIGPTNCAEDFDGRPITAPWMRGWGVKYVSVANAGARAALFAWVDRNLQMGCDGIQQDDCWLQYSSEEWGGDFSSESLAGFGPWLASHVAPDRIEMLGLTASKGFDYRRFLRETKNIHSTADYVAQRNVLPTTPLWRAYLAANVLDYWDQLRSHLAAVRPSAPVSGNVGVVLPNEVFTAIADKLDYTVSEIQAADDSPPVYRLYGATADAFTKPFVGSFIEAPNDARWDQRIAMAYASGIVPIAPYDVFMPGSGGPPPPRLYADPAPLVPIFDFVRQRRALLDLFRCAGTIGLAVPVDRFSRPAMLALVSRLTMANVPFRILPVGGVLRPLPLDIAAIQACEHIILTNPPGDYPAVAMSAFNGSGIQILAAREVEDAFLAATSIGRPVGRSDWNLIVRELESIPCRCVFHVTPAVFGASPLQGIVQIRRGNRWTGAEQLALQIHRPGQQSITLTPAAMSDTAFSFEVPTVNCWAMLEPVTT